MKTKFTKIFAAVTMLLSFVGFSFAQLTITPTLKNGSETLNLEDPTQYVKQYVGFDVPETATLELVCEGATIKYSVDGTDPLGENGEAYEGPIALGNLLKLATVDNGVMIWAKATKEAETGEVKVELYPQQQADGPSLLVAALLSNADGDYMLDWKKNGNPAPDMEQFPEAFRGDGTGIYEYEGVEDGWTLSLMPMALSGNDVKIYYTLDGTEPSEASTEWEEDIVLAFEEGSNTLVVKAVAKEVAEGAGKSELAVIPMTFTFTKANTEGHSVTMCFIAYAQDPKPACDPTEIEVGYGLPAMIGLQVVGADDKYQPAEIYYTLDGTTEPSKEAYTEGGAIKKLDAPESQADIYFTENVDAAKFKAYVGNGDDIIESDVLTIKVTVVKAAKPTIIPASGTLTEQDVITIEAEGEGAQIWYTLDGTDPDIFAEDVTAVAYEDPIPVPADQETLTVKAISFMMADDEQGLLYSSEVTTATYTIGAAVSETVEVEDLAALNALYSTFEEDQEYSVKGEVTITSIVVSGSRTNAWVQDKACEKAAGHSMLLYGVTLPEGAKVGDVMKGLKGKLTEYENLLEMKDIVAADLELAGTAQITIDDVTIAALNSDETMMYQNAMVRIADVEFVADTTFVGNKNYAMFNGADTINFRTNNGADYVGMKIPAEKVTVVGYMGYFKGEYQISPRTKADIITGSVVVEVAAPTFDPEAGAVKAGTKVTVSSTTEGAEIWIAMGEEGAFEKKSEVTISEAVTLRAFAAKEGVYSDTVKASYTIMTANEGNELAGVSVYPNPNNGEFHVTVPVEAMVEVFTVNGQQVHSMSVASGKNLVKIENAGIYFVRVRANGQAAIRKVVVR